MEVSAGVGVQARIGGDQNLPQHLGQHDEVPVCLVLEDLFIPRLTIAQWSLNFHLKFEVSLSLHSS